MAVESIARTAVEVKGDLKCYHCGHVSGELVGRSDLPFHLRTFNPAGDCERGSKVGDRFFCCRCGGPVFLDDIEVVRERTFKCVIDPYETRPGRRPGSKNKNPRRLLQAS